MITNFNDMLPDFKKSNKLNDWSIDLNIRLLELNGYKCWRDNEGVDKNHSLTCYSDNNYLLILEHEFQKDNRYVQYVKLVDYVPLKNKSFVKED